MKTTWKIVLWVLSCCFFMLALTALRVWLMDVASADLKFNNKGQDAVRVLSVLAFVGDKTAAEILGVIYAYGVAGVPKDDEKAIYWFRRQGWPSHNTEGSSDDPAVYQELQVGKAYMTGEGSTPIDLKESRKWLQRAAAGGSKEAMALLQTLGALPEIK